MLAAFLPETCPPLESWGTVADLGSEILEGECAASGLIVASHADAAITCGYFSVTSGTFRMVYPFTEHATVISGTVTLTNETSGEVRTYGPGEGWFVEKGTPVLWKVETPSFTKNYMSVG